MIESINQRVRALQNQHCLWVHLIGMVAVGLSAAEAFTAGSVVRAIALTLTLPPQAWIAYRAYRNAVTDRELVLAIVTSGISLCITTWPIGSFDHPKVLSALGIALPALVAAFGFRAIKFVVVELVAVVAMTLVVDHTIGLDVFQLAAQTPTSPTLSVVLFLVVLLFFIALIARVSAKQTVWLEESVQEAQRQEATAERFLSNMSYEIRNPLHGIKGVLEEIEAETHEAETKQLAHTGIQASERLRALVDDVLDYQRIREGKLTLHPVPFDFSAFHRECVTLVRNYNPERKPIVHRSTASTDLPTWVLGDPNRCFQILMNLVSNAFKFTEQGYVTIDTSYDWEKGTVKLSVSDTGPGMDSEALRDLLARFAQGTGDVKQRLSGSGLGLTITQELVRLMGGYLDVDSELGQGSRFTVVVPLPLWDQPLDVVSTRQEASLTPDGEVSLRRHTILCVDDDPLSRRFVRTPLEKLGASVILALSVNEALTILADHQVDLIIVDVDMPDMSGLAPKEAIKMMPSELPVLAITGNSTPTHLERYEEHGFAEVITKPFSTKALIGSVLSNLRKA